MKIFDNAKNRNGSGFLYLKHKSPRIDEGKGKGVLITRQIREMRDSAFDNNLNDSERRVWRTFKAVTTNFTGNSKAGNYGPLV
jgi:hypothetical protein